MLNGKKDKWMFNKEDIDKLLMRTNDLEYRHQAASYIQVLGNKIRTQQIISNTAIVFMHRFYTQHSFSAFNRYTVSTACMMLACKVEEQPRRLDILIRASHSMLHPKAEPLSSSSSSYHHRAQEIIMHEHFLIETLGFELSIDHPHSHVIQITDKIKASRDLCKSSYLFATNSLHLTTMCLCYCPKVIACVCINLACKWGNWEIPKSNEGRSWWEYFTPPGVTQEKINDITAEFFKIMEKYPTKLKVSSQKSSNNDPATIGRYECHASKANTSSEIPESKISRVTPQNSKGPSAAAIPSRVDIKEDSQQFNFESTSINLSHESQLSNTKEEPIPYVHNSEVVPQHYANSVAMQNVMDTSKSNQSTSACHHIENISENYVSEKKQKLTLQNYKDRMKLLKTPDSTSCEEKNISNSNADASKDGLTVSLNTQSISSKYIEPSNIEQNPIASFDVSPEKMRKKKHKEKKHKHKHRSREDIDKIAMSGKLALSATMNDSIDNDIKAILNNTSISSSISLLEINTETTKELEDTTNELDSQYFAHRPKKSKKEKKAKKERNNKNHDVLDHHNYSPNTYVAIPDKSHSSHDLKVRIKLPKDHNKDSLKRPKSPDALLTNKKFKSNSHVNHLGSSRSLPL